MLRMIRFVFIACFAGSCLAAAAAPRNIGDCEQIQAADAYNRCLASFGPVARTRSNASALSFAPAEETASQSDKRAGAFAEQGRRGRLRMMFSPDGR